MVQKSFKTRELHDCFGAEIYDIQLSGDISAEDLAQIKALWLRYELLLFRTQDLSKQDLVDFSRLIGELEIHVRAEWLNEEHPEILQISNLTKDGKPVGALSNTEVGWHYDQIYLPRPALGSLLFSVKIPPERGATYFSDMATAYERLPRDLKDMVDGRHAIQSYANFNAQFSTKTDTKQTTLTPDIKQPLVRTHPISSRRALYLCPGMTTQIVGLPEDESRDVLNQLFEWTIRDDFVYKHEWDIGDALLWDNACTMHRREPFDSAHERLMYRTTILPQSDLAAPF